MCKIRSIQKIVNLNLDFKAQTKLKFNEKLCFQKQLSLKMNNKNNKKEKI